MISLMPYIGGKHRMAREIAKRLRATGADTLVDVFGGSAAVTLNAGFAKRVWNDASADLAMLFQCLANPSMRADLLQRLTWTPVCRRIFTDDYAIYLRGGFSFSLLSDPVERARATLYRQLLSWGGKGRSGGFSAGTGDRKAIKEVLRYQNVLAKLDAIGEFFRGTCIENLDYQDAVRIYGCKINCVLFCDPPYDGTEVYYSQAFGRADHVFLAHLLATVPAPAVCTYYDTPLIRELYPETGWTWDRVCVTKNSALRKGNKPRTEEIILTKRQPNTTAQRTLPAWRNA
jgi:DNA adenine methylase